MEVARTIRELLEKCDKDIRKIFHKLTKNKVQGPPFEDLVHSFYMYIWKSNMYKGGFDFDDPESCEYFTPYVYTACTRYLSAYCRSLFGGLPKKNKGAEAAKALNAKARAVRAAEEPPVWGGTKQAGWRPVTTLRDLRGREVDVFTVAVGAGHSNVCSSFAVSTAGGADALWGANEGTGEALMKDYLRKLKRCHDFDQVQKAKIRDMVLDLHGGMNMREVVGKMGGESELYSLRRQARGLMRRYRTYG